MSKKYVIGIDQSTQGTKGLLFDDQGRLAARCDLSHKQIVNDLGWVEHDPIEIIENTKAVVKQLFTKAKVSPSQIAGIGISNQRETAMVWDKTTGEPLYNAIVWQCARGQAICDRIEENGFGPLIKAHTGLPLSPYFSAAKIGWILENVAGAAQKNKAGQLCCGTMDSWLVYQLTDKAVFATDYSNASRTQLFNIMDLHWDQEICDLFQINVECLADVKDSNGYYGETDMGGLFPNKVPIHGVLGDSHGALLGQGCIEKGMIKSTYGTGSSVMMNIGETKVLSKEGVVTSLAWGLNGTVNYVLEGNINYTGAVVRWIEKDLGIVASAKETEEMADKANPKDITYLVPAFTGLGAPYWDSKATGILSGITRTTGRAEIARAALDCIAYQITDIVKVMGEEAFIPIKELRVDGGPTKNNYLMQFQSNMLNIPVKVPQVEELSGMGAAIAAGIGLGIYDMDHIFEQIQRKTYTCNMEEDKRKSLYDGWKQAVSLVLTK